MDNSQTLVTKEYRAGSLNQGWVDPHQNKTGYRDNVVSYPESKIQIMLFCIVFIRWGGGGGYEGNMQA